MAQQSWNLEETLRKIQNYLHKKDVERTYTQKTTCVYQNTFCITERELKEVTFMPLFEICLLIGIFVCLVVLVWLLLCCVKLLINSLRSPFIHAQADYDRMQTRGDTERPQVQQNNTIGFLEFIFALAGVLLYLSFPGESG